MPKSKRAKWRGKFDKQNKQDRPGDEAIGKRLLETLLYGCLTRTGNYQIHEFDVESGLDFPI